MNEPLRTAINLYERAGWDFNADLARCLAVGEVHSTDSFFVMGYPVAGNGFYVRFMAGSLKAAIRQFGVQRYDFFQFARELKHRKGMRSINSQTIQKYGRLDAMGIRS